MTPFFRNFHFPMPPKILVALFLLCAIFVSGQAKAQHYLIKTYQEWDGMPTNPVFDATQDSLGHMWFTTRVGLVSYDGQDWSNQNFGYLASAQVHTKLLSDTWGHFWGVASQDPLRFYHKKNEIWQTHFYPDMEFRNYLITGLEILNRDPGSFLAVTSTYRGQVISFDGEVWDFQDLSSRVNAITTTELVGSTLYLATSNGLFFRDLNVKNSSFEKATQLPPGPITHLAKIEDTSTLWVVGPHWLGQLTSGTLKILAENLDITPLRPDSGTTALAEGKNGIYFGDLASTHFFHTSIGLEILTKKNGLIADGCTSFFRDRENNIWITSTRGLSKLVSRRFAGYNLETGLLEDEVSAILERRNGDLVLGQQGGLSIVSEGISNRRFKNTPRALARVMDLLEDPQGNLWIAANRRGLGRLNSDDSITWFAESDGLGFGIYALHLDSNNTLWVGTSKGLFFKSGPEFKRFTLPTTESNFQPMIRSIAPGPDDSFYLATPHLGILKHDQGKITIIRPLLDQEGRNTFYCLARPDSSIWVGTSEGLFVVEDNKLVRSSHPVPIITDAIYSMIQDSQDRVWFGTDHGVFKWNGQDLRNYTRLDGLLGNEANRQGLFEASDKTIWIGTDSGASQYFDIFDQPASGNPGLQITEIRINQNPFSPTKNHLFQEPLHSLEFNFKGISFLDENNIQFRTRLLNYENNWNVSDRFTAPNHKYINVPAGRYQFQVQAIRQDGINSKIIKSGWITIKPAFRDRWYIRTLFGMLVLAVIWTVLALISGKRYAHRLEEEVLIQTKELRLSEETTRSESQRLAATLKNISDGVLAVDFEGVIVLANAASGKILKQRQADILGKKQQDILPLKPDSIIGPQRIAHPDNPLRILEVSSAVVGPALDQPDPLNGARVIAFRDITDQLHQEEDRIRTQKLESLGVFAGGLAHDFNNLLTVMLGNLSVLETSENLSNQEFEMLTLVKDASKRAQNLTRQLLTFAMGGEPLLEKASLGSILRQSVEFALSGSNVSCNLDLPENLWPVVVDPGQIDQVFTNLVLNAAQAMPKGGTLQVIAQNIGSESRRMILVEIIDEGHGIPPENLSRIYDPYFSTKEMGSGLGLAIAYSIISRHGGHITVESDVGIGSVFRVFLRAE